MSLFKLKTLWSASYPEEQFDHKHLVVGKIFDKPCIVLGSYRGFFRVYLAESQNNKLNVFSIYEADFQEPIIDVKFVTHPDSTIPYAVGILFFKKFGCMSFQRSSEKYIVKVRFIQVEPAFALSATPLSVMTLNSKIQYINPVSQQNIKVSEPVFPYAWSMENIYYMDGEELVLFRGYTQQWRIIVGSVKFIHVLDEKVIMIGQNAVWEAQKAIINKFKAFQDEISYGTIIVKTVTSYNILVANYNAQIMIYTSDYELIWAIKLDEVPLKIVVCQHPAIKGLLAILTHNGTIQIAYSGTEISEETIKPLKTQISIQQIESETAFLKKELEMRKDNKNKSYEGLPGNKDDISVKANLNVQKTNDHIQNANKLFRVNNAVIRSVLKVQIRATRENVRNVKARIQIPSNMISDVDELQVKSIQAKEQLKFNMYTSNEKYPFNQYITLIIRYESTKNKQIQVYRQKIRIPLQSQCQIINFESPAKLEHKIVIESNTQLPSFNQIFPELFKSNATQQRKSVTFQLANTVQCTITYNKTYQKARLESQYYGGLCYIFVEFTKHLQKINANNKLMVEVPLEEFFGIMKEHFDYRITLKQTFENVGKRSQEFRSTQKKLLLKMKQKMSSVNHIDKLLEYTYKALVESANIYEGIRQQMDVINHNLQVAIKFVTQMVFLRVEASEQVRKTVMGILGYEEESIERGWEETVIANSAHFLNRKYNPDEQITFEKIQKIPLWIIAKVNNNQWTYQ